MRFLIILVLVFTGSLYASEQLAKEQGCFECHALRGPKLAPGFMGASKHAQASPNPKEFLTKIIKEGSSGMRPRFKDQVMPPYGHLDAKTVDDLAEWILSLSNNRQGKKGNMQGKKRGMN